MKYLAAIITTVIYSWTVWLLWNWAAVAALPFIHHITWFQAWGLLALSNFLFKSSKS